ncbi:MAG TPA: hypothetical protein VHO70_21310 [Chitinispirillaceae bacterium]|nr:hypothetical protein [Chitinispirillaceae bacterium]
MDRKIITAITLGLLFAVFGLISFLVFISNRHPYFVEKKLHLGALILSLSGAAIGCKTISCYIPVQPNIITIDKSTFSSDTIVINNTETDSITGNIGERSGNTFSYAVLDSSGRIITKSNILPADGTFDESTEDFSFKFNASFTPGNYLKCNNILKKSKITICV